MLLTQSKDGANLDFCYHTHFQADLSAFSGNAIPEMRILPDCERFFHYENNMPCRSAWTQKNAGSANEACAI
jgi:hypothetical protein